MQQIDTIPYLDNDQSRQKANNKIVIIVVINNLFPFQMYLFLEILLKK